jgi:hypothetical protein
MLEEEEARERQEDKKKQYISKPRKTILMHKFVIYNSQKQQTVIIRSKLKEPEVMEPWC